MPSLALCLGLAKSFGFMKITTQAKLGNLGNRTLAPVPLFQNCCCLSHIVPIGSVAVPVACPRTAEPSAVLWGRNWRRSVVSFLSPSPSNQRHLVVSPNWDMSLCPIWQFGSIKMAPALTFKSIPHTLISQPLSSSLSLPL